jgi:hypothetical protein
MQNRLDFSPATVQNLAELTSLGLLSLRGLVYRSKEYGDNRGYYGDVYAVIKAAATAGKAALDVPPETRDDTQNEQLAVAQYLAAVCWKLGTLPGIAVESEGSQERRNFFSSVVNWEELARDVLNQLYIPPGENALGSSFFTVDRNPAFPIRQVFADETFLLRLRPWWTGVSWG